MRCMLHETSTAMALQVKWSHYLPQNKNALTGTHKGENKQIPNSRWNFSVKMNNPKI